MKRAFEATRHHKLFETSRVDCVLVRYEQHEPSKRNFSLVCSVTHEPCRVATVLSSNHRVHMKTPGGHTMPIKRGVYDLSDLSADDGKSMPKYASGMASR